MVGDVATIKAEDLGERAPVLLSGKAHSTRSDTLRGRCAPLGGLEPAQKHRLETLGITEVQIVSPEDG